MHLPTILIVLPLALSAPSREPVELAPLYKRNNVTPHNYIVKLKDDVRATSQSSALNILASEPYHTYSDVIKGFAASLDAETLNAMRGHPDVEYIQEDGISRALGYITQDNAAWGLARLSNKRPGARTYTYDSSAGEGTCAYSVDTGVDDKHPDFEGRALQVKSYIPGSNRDDHGHGTHTSGTMGSKTYGVAKKTKIYGIKVLGSDATGPDSGIVKALDDLPQDIQQRSCPKGVVVNLSLGADSRLQSMNDAVASLVRKGYFVAAAAGNANHDANNDSPASEPTICTVGATESNDAKASYSNYGRIIDIQAPGSNVQSTYPGGGYGTMSGTSMASPHVAGLAAYLMAFEGVKGGAACDRIKQLATKNAIRGVPSGTTSDLVFNGNPSA